MVQRFDYENSSEIAVFCKLTNAYCLVGRGQTDNFYNEVRRELAELEPKIPVINCYVAGTSIVGRVCAGNTHGLLVPEDTTDAEFKVLRDNLPESVEIRRVDEKLSALGNVVACNDKVAIIHPEAGNELKDLLKTVLKVKVFRTSVAGNGLVGTYCCLNSKGALVPPTVPEQKRQELSKLLEIPVFGGTVNRGSECIGAGVTANDSIIFCGAKTSPTETLTLESTFKSVEFPTNSFPLEKATRS